MTSLWNYCIAEESGQGLVEYGLIVALIAVVLIGTLTNIGTSLSAKFQEIEAAL